MDTEIKSQFDDIKHQFNDIKHQLDKTNARISVMTWVIGVGLALVVGVGSLVLTLGSFMVQLQ